MAANPASSAPPHSLFLFLMFLMLELRDTENSKSTSRVRAWDLLLTYHGFDWLLPDDAFLSVRRTCREASQTSLSGYLINLGPAV